MAYCRLSSDDYKCDVYCYASVGGGYQIHLAYRRLKQPLDVPPRVPLELGPDGNVPPEQFEKFYARANLVLKLMETAEKVVIEHPWAGESFWCATAEECAEKLREIRAAGFNMPAGVEEDVLGDADAVDDAGREHEITDFTAE